MGGSVSACAGKGSLCAGKEKKGRKEPKPEKYPKKRKRREKQLRETLQEKTSSLDGLKASAEQLMVKISQNDRDLVDQRVRDTEHKHTGLLSSIDQKLSGYGLLENDMSSIRSQAQDYLAWLEQCDANIKVNDEDQAQTPEILETKLDDVKAMEHELSVKQPTLDTVAQKAHTLLSDLPSGERETMEQLLVSVQTKHNELCEKVSEKKQHLEDMVSLAREIQERINSHRTWLEETTASVDQFDVIRLSAADVEKQIEKCKTTLSKVQSKLERLKEIKAKVAELEEISSEGTATDLNKTVEDLTAEHEELVSRFKQQQNNLRDWADSRHRFESDCGKVDRWTTDTALKCATDRVDIQTPEERLAELKNLSNTVQVFKSLVKETVDRGETFFPSLMAEEHPLLKEQLDALKEKFNRVSDLVLSSAETLETTLKTQGQAQEDVNQCEQFLQAVQAEIKKETGPVGFDVKDAELMLAVFQNIEEKLTAYKPTMQQQNDSCDQLKQEGQESLADDISRLSGLYDTLCVQTQVQLEACKSAVNQRQAFADLLGAQSEVLSECGNTMEAAHSLPVQERLDHYKDVLDKLHQLELDLPITTERAAHIGTQGSQDDLALATAAVEDLAAQTQTLKADAQTHMAQCETFKREKKEFESTVNTVMTWLEEKENVLASCAQLHLDSAQVKPAIAKHKATSSEAIEKLRGIKQQAEAEKSRYEALSEPLPEDLVTGMQQIDALEESISSAIAKKENYLNEALTDRQQLENSMKQVTDWLHGASEMLDSGVHGLDYDTLENTLSEFTDYFSEASLCQDELDQVTELADKLKPSLDTNDAATLEQSLANVNRKIFNITNSANTKQTNLEEKVGQWKDFKEQLSTVNERLSVLETEWQEVDKSTDASPDAVNTHLEFVKTFLEHAESTRPKVDDLNQVARDLERAGNQDSRTAISRLVGAVNERWESLTGQAEARILTLEDIGGQWGDFTAMMGSVKTVLQESDTKLSIITIEDATLTDINQHLDSLKDITSNLERIDPLVSRLQTSSMTLQRSLPTAEAKISSQEQFMILVEGYEKMVERTQEMTAVVQEEADTRQNALSELSQYSDWLQTTLTSVSSQEASGAPVDERLSTNKMIHSELILRMERVKDMKTSLESKYIEEKEDAEMPGEITQKLDEVTGLEQNLEEALREADKQVKQLMEDRSDFRKRLADITAWVHRADLQLQDRTTQLDQATDDHQTLLGQFDDLKADLDHLRSKGEEIIKDSSDPEEKQSVQRSLAEVNRQWLSLQAQTADRTASLSEADDLSRAINDVSSGLEAWLDQAEQTISVDLNWTDAEVLREQLSGHRQVEKEVPTNQDKVTALGAMVKQLEQACPAPDSAARVTKLKQRLDTVHTKAGVQLSALEDANQRLTDFEREVSELMRWLEQTRARMTMRDTTTDLKSQLEVQEVS